MTSITFPRPTTALLSMNDNHHWRREARDVKAWRECAAWCGRHEATNVNHTPAAVHVILDVHENRRRDPANFTATVKPIIDGLVDAGWWPDDTPPWVTVLEPGFRLVPRTDPLMVTVQLLPRTAT